jgi:hypothetical protein
MFFLDGMLIAGYLLTLINLEENIPNDLQQMFKYVYIANIFRSVFCNDIIF